MTYPDNYFTEPTAREQKRGIVAEVETTWGTYTIYERNGKVWIEAIGNGGATRRMPQVSTAEEAKEIVWQNTKPLSKSDAISF